MNAIGKMWMAKDLYEECLICRGAGSIDPTRYGGHHPGIDAEAAASADGMATCPSCGGVKFVKIGMTVGQLERLQGELERFKRAARAAEASP